MTPVPTSSAVVYHFSGVLRELWNRLRRAGHSRLQFSPDFSETFPPLTALIAVTEETVKTGGSDRQTYGNTPLSVKPPATEEQIRSALLRDLLELTARFTDATGEFEMVMGKIPSGLSHSDGVQRIKNASSKLSTARKELVKVHRRLDECRKTLSLQQ
jgi:hypothetical protein